MCDPADLELGKAQDEAIDHAEMKMKLAERARFGADRGLAAEREKAMAVVNEAAKDREQQKAVQRIAPTPSVVRNVHYVAYGTPGGEFPAGKHRAAIITDVPEANGVADALNTVSLCILNPTGFFFTQNVPYDPTAQTPGTWHWPEIV